MLQNVVDCVVFLMENVRLCLQVLQRLAPLKRGIFEDYVANFWCATSILAKWKQLFSIPALTFMSLGATTAAILPSMVQQICAPSTKGFVLAMLNSSLAFYLFAYQGANVFGAIFSLCWMLA